MTAAAPATGRDVGPGRPPPRGSFAGRLRGLVAVLLTANLGLGAAGLQRGNVFGNVVTLVHELGIRTDQADQFLGDVDVRPFDRAAHQVAEAAVRRLADEAHRRPFPVANQR